VSHTHPKPTRVPHPSGPVPHYCPAEPVQGLTGRDFDDQFTKGQRSQDNGDEAIEIDALEPMSRTKETHSCERTNKKKTTKTTTKKQKGKIFFTRVS